MSGRRPGVRGAAAVVALALGPVVAVACTDGVADAPTVGGEVTLPPGSDPSTPRTPTPTPTPTTSDDPPDATDPPAPTGPPTDQPAPCDPEAASGQPGSLVVWHALSGEGQVALDAALERFRAAHPGIEVTVEVFQGYTNALDALRDRDPDELPDLFLGITASLRKLQGADLFFDPVDCVGPGPSVLDDLLPVVEATYTADGTLRAVPFNVSTPVLLYDALRFERAGLDPDDPPSTPEELRAAAEQLVASGEASTGIVFYDESASWLVEQWAAQEDRVLAAPDNGVSGDVTEFDFTHPNAVEALAWARQLRRDGLAEFIGLNEAGISDLLRMVDPDTPAGFTLHTSASLGDILIAQESGAFAPFETRAAPLPGPALGGLVGGGAWWLRDHDDAVRNGQAWLLAEFLLQPEQQAELAAASGYVPAVTTALDEPVLVERWAAVPAFEAGYRQLESMGTSPAAVGMQVVPRAEIQRVLQIAAEEVVRADADPLAALTRAEAAAANLLAAFDLAGGG